MKIIKKILVVIMIITMVFVVTDINAYTGGVVDAGDEIALPSFLINGNGIVETATSISNGKMYYQFVEMSKEKYDQIRKMKDELNVAEYFNIYENNKTDDNYDNYASALAYYKQKYREELTNFRPEHIDELRDQIIGNLPDYTDNWTLTSENLVSMDLSSFSGTKYYTAWVKVESGARTVYDAQIYDLTGTKSDTENNNNNNSNNTEINAGVIDAGDEIGMPVISVDGTGKVTLANNITNYQMYYQINEIEKSKYDEIRKLKDELNVAVYFNIYENNNTDENYDNYASARKYYKDTYGEELTNFTAEHIDELRDQIKGLLPRYTENWTQTTNDMVDTNLSSFSGTKYVVMWVKVISGDRTIYDGDIYNLTGTKQEIPVTPTNPDEEDKPTTPTNPDEEDKPTTPTNPDEEDKPTTPTNPDEEDKPTTPTNPDENDKPTTPTTPDNSSEKEDSSNKDDSSNKKEENEQEQTNNDKTDKNEQSSTTTSSSNKGTTSTSNATTSSKELPYAGNSNIIMIGAIIMAVAVSITSFVKFKKLK